MDTTPTFADDPIARDEDDRLHRAPFVNQMEAALRAAGDTHASSVFALVGPWGAGKSSVLHLLVDKLESRWKIVEFNPWSYPDDASLQLGFFRELHAVLPQSGRAAKARAALGRLSTSIAPVGGILGAFTGVDGDALLTSVGKLLEGDLSTSKAYEDAISALREAPQPILMIMDDLDRLDPAELVRVAKLVRLVGRLPNVFYLLSYDEATLLEVLTRTPLVGTGEGRAKDYLEKIVQVRFDLPPLRPTQTKALVGEHLDALQARLGITLNEPDHQRLDRAVEYSLLPRLHTVRGINRFFAQLDQLSSRLAEEVDFTDYVLLTWLRTAEPRVYALLHRDREWALGVTRAASLWLPKTDHDDGSERRRILLERVRDCGVDSEHVEDVAALLGTLFPALRSDLIEARSRRAVSEDAPGKQRVSDPDYFDRYFAYLVPDGDVSDSIVRRGVNALNNGQESTADLRALAEALAKNGALVQRKLENEQPDPSRLISWVLTYIEDQSASDGDMTAVEGLLQRAFLRLETKTVDTAIALLTNTDAGRRQLLRLGASLRSGRDLSAMYARVPIERVNALWDRVQRKLIDVIPSTLRSQTPAAGHPASSEYMEGIWLWESVTPGAAKAWLSDLRVSGDWPLKDQLKQLVSSGYSSALPGVPVLDHLPRSLFLDLFDPHKVAKDLERELRDTPSFDGDDWRTPDTPTNRYLIAINDVRQYIRDLGEVNGGHASSVEDPDSTSD